MLEMRTTNEFFLFSGFQRVFPHPVLSFYFLYNRVKGARYVIGFQCRERRSCVVRIG